jgi:NADPH:quinone reductase-like Zn-dependent oxidoreductase
MVEEINRDLFPHLESGAVKPVIDSEFPLADAAQAHAYMERGVHVGKILLRP